MSRSLYRFDYNIMKQQNNPCIKEFFHLVENQISDSALKTQSHKNPHNSQQNKLLQTYNKALRLNIYYFALYAYLNDHKEWCVKHLCDTYESDVIAYTPEELELLYRKHLQYREASEYIYHILYSDI